MTKIKTPTTVKNEIRTAVFETMRVALATAYGAENVFRIGDTEVAVKVGNAPSGEPIYATFAPTVKDYTNRTTNTKTIKAFDLTAEVNAYERKVAERDTKAAEAAEKKAAKVEADKARREANAKAKAEHAKAKADKVDALTAYKNAKLNDVTVKAKT
jgi:hypothetical protein